MATLQPIQPRQGGPGVVQQPGGAGAFGGLFGGTPQPGAGNAQFGNIAAALGSGTSAGVPPGFADPNAITVSNGSGAFGGLFGGTPQPGAGNAQFGNIAAALGSGPGVVQQPGQALPVQQMPQPGGFQGTPGGFNVNTGLPAGQPGVPPYWNPGQQAGNLPLPPPMAVPPGVPPTGLIGSEQALQGGLQGALQALQGGTTLARGDVLRQTALGTGPLNQFVSPGQQAQQRQAALSGALGQGAQQRAFDQFMDSPGQAFLRERGEQAVTRNAAALGGLGGGRVQQELQRQGIGLAAQDFQNQFDRLGSVTGQGLQAAGLSGQLRGNAASTLGQLQMQGGLAAGQFAHGTGRDLASGRTQAGRDIATSIGGATSALSNLVNQQGQGASDLIGQGGSNLAGVLERAGQGQALNQEQLAALLSGQQLTGSGQIAGLPGLPGVTQDPGLLGRLSVLGGTGGLPGLATGIGTAIGGFG